MRSVPSAAALLTKQLAHPVNRNVQSSGEDVPHIAAFLAERSNLKLHTIHPVDAVNEEDEDEDKGNLIPS
jgi:hypothetical protein